MFYLCIQHGSSSTTFAWRNPMRKNRARQAHRFYGFTSTIHVEETCFVDGYTYSSSNTAADAAVVNRKDKHYGACVEVVNHMSTPIPLNLAKAHAGSTIHGDTMFPADIPVVCMPHISRKPLGYPRMAQTRQRPAKVTRRPLRAGGT